MNTTEMKIPSNRVSDIRRYCREQLRGLYPDGEIESMVRLLFEAYLGWDTTQILLHGTDTINQSDLLKFHWAIEYLKHYRPIQHIIGYTDFCDCRIHVSPDVLIPRPETEEIVRNVIDLVRQKTHATSGINILDLCTGSGCMAIALARAIPQATIVAVDLSEKALAMAERNAQANNVEIQYLRADVLDTETLTSQLRALSDNGFDIIVSNPPYVMESERREMQRNVTDYEPAMALFVPDAAPLRFYRSIAAIASALLSSNGFAALEINEQLGIETATLFTQRGLVSTIRKDFRNRDRMIIASKQQ